jgi:hydrogenase expression/formation protein HypC
MCLAIPGKLLEIYEENGLQMGRIDYAGTVNTACLAYVPEVKLGEYLIVHAGFAISILNEEEVENSFKEWERLVENAERDGLI